MLYNDLSGDTHLLTDSALHILNALRAAPADESALAAGLRAEFDTADGEVTDAEVDALLRELQALALIEVLA